MTRACMFCEKTFGEKCPHCGSENVVWRWNTDLEGEEKAFKVFTCLNALCTGLRLSNGTLAPAFKEGDGPNHAPNVKSHGICRDCLKLPEEERMKKHREMRRSAGLVEVCR